MFFLLRKTNNLNKVTKTIIFPTLLLLAASHSAVAQSVASVPAQSVVTVGMQKPMTINDLFNHIEQSSRSLIASKTGVEAAQMGVETARSQRLPDISAQLSMSLYWQRAAYRPRLLKRARTEITTPRKFVCT